MENLIRVSTYAKKINKSVTWVYKLAEKKEIKIKTMKKYEVTAINDEEQDVTEFVQGDSILEAISEFYNEFGYQEILKIEVVGIFF